MHDLLSPIPGRANPKVAVAALASFNDVIIRHAFLAGLPLIDVRYVCDADADYANSIEPSEAGGAKIARAIIQVANEYDFTSKKTTVLLGTKNTEETGNQAKGSFDEVPDRIDEITSIDDDEEREKAWEDWDKCHSSPRLSRRWV